MLTPFLPKIPNLDFGFLYSFGKNVRTGRFTVDYTLPYHLNADSVLFGEAHAEGWDFWKRPRVEAGAAPGFTTTTSIADNRIDISFGGGYRTMLGANTFFGVNGFYDTSRVYNRWYSSGSAGLEYAAKLAGDDAIDLNFNWYGNLFNRDVLINAFRNKGNSFDLEAGYSHALFDQALDLRLKLTGYQFDIGTAVRGWRGGADLTTRNGAFTVRYEYGHDQIAGYYNTIGWSVTVGFQPENLLKGESPFSLPEPVFRSPRDLRRFLGLKVKRNWYQPNALVLARTTPQPTSCLPIVMKIADTGVLKFCTNYFIPWDGGGAVSAKSLSQVSRIEFTGYVVTPLGPLGEVVVNVGESLSVQAPGDFIFNFSNQIGPPVVNTHAAAWLAARNRSANGLGFQAGGGGWCNIDDACRITDLTVTFYPCP